MNIVVAVAIVVVAAVNLAAAVWFVTALRKDSKEALRYAVTLTGNEGAFVGLCIGKRRNIWTFVDVKIMPSNPGAAVQQAAPGELYVPTRNILYYQEIANVAE